MLSELEDDDLLELADEPQAARVARASTDAPPRATFFHDFILCFLLMKTVYFIHSSFYATVCFLSREKILHFDYLEIGLYRLFSVFFRMKNKCFKK